MQTFYRIFILYFILSKAFPMRILWPNEVTWDGINCLEYGQVLLNQQCHFLFDTCQTNPDEEMVAIEYLQGFEFKYGCRKKKCFEDDQVWFEDSCVKIGETHEKCGSNYTVWVTPFGSGICGCENLLSNGKCIDLGTRQLLTFAKKCPPGFQLFDESRCLPLEKNAETSSRTKRVFLMRDLDRLKTFIARNRFRN